MDPVSIIGLVNASIGLAIKVGQTVKDVQTISSQYKYAEVSIAALSNECRTFATVLKKIEVWLRIVDSDVTHDELILEQLSSSLECGNIVLEAMNDDLLDFTKTWRKKSPWSKTKFLFNEGVFDAHQKRIGGQLQALSCLLQSMNL
jgi:6-phosphogluconate dehydrogenase (decarboxylating)